MHRSSFVKTLAVVAVALGAAACGSDSTGPKALTASQAATAIDGVYGARLAAGTSTDSEIAFFIAEYVELAPAFGAAPRSFTVTTATGNQTWMGFDVEEAVGGGTSNPHDGDSSFYFVAYPNISLSTFLVVEEQYDSLGGVGGGSILFYDTDSGAAGTSVTASAALLSTGAACSLQTGLRVDSLYSTVTDPCVQNTIRASFSGDFAGTGLDASLASLTFSNVTLNGVRFYAGTGADRAPRLGPTRAALLGSRLGDLLQRYRATH